ncbi:glyoxalase [Leucobacter sp. cx-87]|nr:MULTISPECIES: VOC family protein [unclassified Leucobacter]MBC9935708.1 glyoxalase [Leucobacter sp. cx-87]
MVGIGADRVARQGGHVTSQVFVNLTTRDLARSQTFYEALGCTINPQFSDENAICVIWSDEIYFMMLLPEFFDSFGGKPIADPAQFTQVRTAFSRDSKVAVDAIVDAALSHGGALTGETQDLGFMYGRAVEDPDGNILEFFFMDMEAAAAGMEAE